MPAGLSRSVCGLGCALMAFLLLNCSDNLGPVDDFSLWSGDVTQQPLPDTLYYGDNLTYIIGFGDSAGRPVQVTVSGLPSSITQTVGRSGDTTLVTLVLVADSLLYDSLYSIDITAVGSGPEDSLLVSLSLFVADSNRLGGVRKLARGMYWRETQMDTITSVKDSANTRTTEQVTYEHRKYTEVTDVREAPDAFYYTLQSFDTIVELDSVEINWAVLKHDLAEVRYLIDLPDSVVFADSLNVTSLELPVAIGNSWPTISIDIDTTIAIDIDTSPGVLNLPLNFTGQFRGQAQIAGMGSFTGTSGVYSCVNLLGTSNAQFAATIDTTWVLPSVPPDTVFVQGDTLSISNSNTTNDQCFSVDLAVQFSNREVEVGIDTSYADTTRETNTTIKQGRLTSYFDPRVGAVLDF